MYLQFVAHFCAQTKFIFRFSVCTENHFIFESFTAPGGAR